jgi:hypothetical protein
MSGHLLKKTDGHLLRIDGRIYDQGYLVGVLPTHLLRGARVGNRISPYTYSKHQLYLGVDQSINPTIPSADEVREAIMEQYASQISSVTNRSYDDCYSSSVSRYLDRGNGSEYLCSFIVRFWILSFPWPNAYSIIPGIKFPMSITGSSRDIEVRVKSSDLVQTGGSISNPRYSMELPSTLEGLQALPGGVFAGDASYDVKIAGPFIKKNRLLIIAYPCNMTPPYQIPDEPQTPSGAYIYQNVHSDFSAQGTVTIDARAVYAVS